MIDWTVKWRKESLLEGLKAYSHRTKDLEVKKWLEDWRWKIESAIEEGIQDSKGDWVQLRAKGYGQDPVLKMCDFGNKGRLAQHLFCAEMYANELKIMTEQQDVTEEGVYDYIRRHLHVLRTNKLYAQAYYGPKQQIDWQGVERFFAAVFQSADEDDLQQHHGLSSAHQQQ
ncbi:hypothetical protein PHMEG_0004114 [Phytophthora megakarya]|uniref:Uncharacterized protein n=1 Tax=Phytophthora megakarya TaxID=4795 RepID=A0A225WUI6_9STRA|nr:hypothetical protein PHMEG_0004114 [Phytophthora megakarya]